MKQVRPAAGSKATLGPLTPAGLGTRAAFGERARLLAVDASAHPYRSTFALLALNAALVALFVPAGQLLFSDPAEFLRELMPGTWLSFGELSFIAAIAWTIHAQVSGSLRLRPDSFWALSAIVFAVFAIDEITQLTIFLADGFTELGALAPAGFRDLDAFLLTVLFLAAGVMLLRFVPALLAHPPAIALLFAGVSLGVASQSLDAILPSTSGEFVAEESLKLAAEPFIVGGYLVVLHRVLSRSPKSARPT
jgi:hypothetical protein